MRPFDMASLAVGIGQRDGLQGTRRRDPGQSARAYERAGREDLDREGFRKPSLRS